MAAAAAHLHGSATAGRTWTQQEQKTFELVLASSFHDPDRWTRVAAQLPGRSLEELLLQFAVLESDIQRICDPAGVLSQPLQQCKKARVEPAVPAGGVANRKGVPWTQEEHRLFLLGLSKFGKGSWRSIARQFVITRTPTQVASHAQKYFLRLNVMKDKKDKRRASIHDMHLH